MKQARFENDHVVFEYVGEIVKGTFKNKKVDLEAAKIIVSERLNFTQNKDVPLMITDVGLKTIEREARDYFSSNEGIKGISASAMVSGSAFGRHLANFFIKISVIKPKFPTRVFSSEEEALSWLKQYL